MVISTIAATGVLSSKSQSQSTPPKFSKTLKIPRSFFWRAPVARPVSARLRMMFINNKETEILPKTKQWTIRLRSVFALLKKIMLTPARTRKAPAYLVKQAHALTAEEIKSHDKLIFLT